MAKSITDLKNTVNDSAQMISNQLQGVDFSLLGAFIAVISSAFISNALGIIRYWVPASFILMWILLFNSFTKSYVPWFRKRDRQERIVKTEVAISQSKGLFSERNMFLLTTILKNGVPLFRAIGIIFFISFISLVIHVKEIVENGSSISITIPIITSLLFISLPFLLHFVLLKLEKIDWKTASIKTGFSLWRIILLLVPFFFLALFLAVAILVLPIWSLVSLYPIYEYNLSALGSLFIVLVLIAVTSVTFMNYFSASMVKKEMTIALFNLSKILNRINEVALSQTVNEELNNEEFYDELVSDYIKAKRYEVSADDSLMVNFYSLVPNKTYLSTIDQKQSETKNKTSE